MKYAVIYHTMNDTYTKVFDSHAEATKFCNMIRVLYPEQRPVVGAYLKR